MLRRRRQCHSRSGRSRFLLLHCHSSRQINGQQEPEFPCRRYYRVFLKLLPVQWYGLRQLLCSALGALRRMSIAEWVRQALVQARRSEPSREVASKMEVIRAAARMDFPTSDIGRMIEEIEQGYGSGMRP